MTVARFTVAYWCILVAAVLPIFCAGIAKWGTFGKSANEGGFDNDHPRAWLARQTDWRARANGAQANSFESLPFFIGAVIIAHQLGSNQLRLDVLAFLFVVLRMMFVMTYVAGLSSARSILWALAFAANVAILFIGFR
jgi:uncharacterized MAPEG superfamily protein